MRCAVCMKGSDGSFRCRECGARMDEVKHRELMGVRYLLGQITRWEEEGTLAADTIASLRARYEKRRDNIKQELVEGSAPAGAPAPPPTAIEQIVEHRRAALPPRVEPPAPVSEPIVAEIIETPSEHPSPRPAPARPIQPPRPLPPPEPSLTLKDHLRNLFTERNVRWLLSIGIGIFCVGLAVYIHTQWQGMTPPTKIGILFGSTLLAALAGMGLRRTMLRVTGTALVVLAAIALPIDFLGIVEFVKGVNPDRVGLWGSLVCIPAYAGLAFAMGESFFAALALVAGAGLYAFALRLLHWSWPSIPPLLPALMLAYAEARAWFVRGGLYREPLRWVAPIGIAVALALCAALLVAGQLDLRADFWTLQAALGATLVASMLAALRTKRPAYSSAVAGVLSAMFVLTMNHLRLPADVVPQWLATFGAALSLAWTATRREQTRWHAAPFIAFGSAFAIASVLAALGHATLHNDLHPLAFALTLAGVQYLGLGWTGPNRWFWGVGALVGGAAILTVLAEHAVPPAWYPVPFAAYGLAHAIASGWWRRRERELSQVAIAASGAAVLVALLYAGAQMLASFVGPAPGEVAPYVCWLGLGVLYAVAARVTAGPWLAHAGTYLIAVAGWLLLGRVGVRDDLRTLCLMPLPAAAMAGAWLEARGKREAFALHLWLSGLLVLSAVLAVTFLTPASYERAHLPGAIGVAAATALIAGFFAFARPERIDYRASAGAMAFFAAFAYVLALKYIAHRGRPEDPLFVFALAPVMCGAAHALRAREFAKQAGSIAIVSGLLTLVAIAAGFHRGTAAMPSYLYVCAAAAALYAALSAVWRSRTFMGYAGAAAVGCALSIVRFADQLHGPQWAGLAAMLVPVAAAVGADVARRRLGEQIALALHASALVSTLVAVVATMDHQPQLIAVLFVAFGLYYALAERQASLAWLVAALFCAIAGEHALWSHLHHVQVARASLCAMTVPLGLFALAWGAHKRRGERFSLALLAAAAVGALLATGVGIEDRIDRVLNLLAIATMAGLASVYTKRPWVMYVSGAALMAANVAAMIGLEVPATHIVVEVLGLALVQSVGARAGRGAYEPYFKPFWIVALVAGAGALAFGFTQPAYVTDRSECAWAIGGMVISALLFAAAGKSERKPAFYYLGAVNMMGAYYLALQWVRLTPADVAMEWYTAPVGVLLMLWNGCVLRDKVDRGMATLTEVLAVGMMTVPSAVVSFGAGKGWHALPLYGLALLVIVGGMMFKRRIYLIGGTGMMIVETCGKAVQFLVDHRTSAAEWGMIIGGAIILLAALFESRKVAFVKTRLEAVQLGAQRYFAGWK